MFLKDAWYAAFWSKDLAGAPLARKILGTDVVLYRGASGKVAALEDRCCHRAAPLSRGEPIGEHLRCGYHGLEYDMSGRCVRIPGQSHIPATARVRSFPVAERWNVVWIWMGEDPARADPEKICALPWLDDPQWTATPGYIHLKANYQLLVDNLLDLTHVTYVHRNTIAGDPREATTPTKTERLGDSVRVGRWMLGFTPPPLFAKAGNFTGPVDRWQFVTWTAPSNVVLDVGCAAAGTGAPQGDRSQGISIWSNHLITPETETTSHYLFAYSRNFRLHDPEISALLYEGSRATFLEDAAMLEAQQQRLDGGAIDGLLTIGADAAQMQARRLLQQLIGA
jgi:phenylpropionate dioxygenase-like ring-hydroxylating dioxygenase large terminal subunit